MYDSVTHYLYEGAGFTLKSDKFFDGWSIKKIDGMFDVRTRYVSDLRNREVKNKRYYPMIELVELTMGRGAEKRRVRRIETQISFPKARFGTSKYEISFEDFDFIIQKNLEYLQMADVVTNTEALKGAIVAELSTPKSMVAPPYFGEAPQVVKRLCYFDHKPRSQFRARDYEIGSMGVSFNFRNDIRGVCGYCKYSEIVENGYTVEEEKIREEVLSGKQRKDIFRFEPSFSKKQTLEAVLRRLIPNKKKDFTLNDIFTNGNIAKKILLKEFDEIFSPLNTALISIAEMKENQLNYILKSDGLSFDDKSLLYYMVNMAGKYGINQLWKSLKEELEYSKYYRIRKKVKQIAEIREKLEKFKEPTDNLVKFLREEIERFELIRPSLLKNCQPSFKNI